MLRQRLGQNQGIGDRNGNQNADMEQMHSRGKVGILGKGAEDIDGRVNQDTGEQASAAVKDRDQQEAHRNGKDNLAQVVDPIHPAAVEQVDDMPDTKGDAGNDNGGFEIILCDGRKQEPPEDHLLQEPDAEHTHDPADRFRPRITESNPVPEVSRRQDYKRHIIEKPPRGDRGSAQPVPFLQLVFAEKGKQDYRLHDAESGTCRVSDSDTLVERVGQRLQNAVNHNPHDGKGQLVFLI